MLSLTDNLMPIGDADHSEFNVTSTSSQLAERMEHLSESLNYFWTRWRDEYLAELQETYRLNQRSTTSRPSISVDDVVVVHDESAPRGSITGRLVK